MTEPAQPPARPLVVIPIKTRKPEKWRWHDLETGEIWRWHDGCFKREPPWPSADYATQWQVLIGYAQQTRDDGEKIEPAELLELLVELRREALRPVKEWMDGVVDGSTNTDSSTSQG